MLAIPGELLCRALRFAESFRIEELFDPELGTVSLGRSLLLFLGSFSKFGLDLVVSGMIVPSIKHSLALGLLSEFCVSGIFSGYFLAVLGSYFILKFVNCSFF